MKPISLLAALLCCCGLLLSACGSDDEGGTGAASSEAATDTKGVEEGAFPVTIEHKHGSTTIESEPKRVTVVGLREQDALLALGVVPVATTEWFGEHPGAIFPWAQEKLGSATPPTVLKSTDGIEVEKVAATRPDLILAVYSGLTKKEYETLSKLAPVVAQPKGQVDYGSSWQQETEITGRAVGRPERAKKLVTETERLIADTAAAHPQWKGRTAAVVTDYQGIYLYGPEDIRTRTLESLGFTFPDRLAKVVPDDFGVQLSDEKTDLVDVDALVWLADGERTPDELKKVGVYADLRVRKEGRDVFVLEDDRALEALSFTSVLSFPLLLKELAPRLDAAVDGDPQTSTDQQ